MEPMDAFAWPYLLGGLVCGGAGWALRARGRVSALFTLLGSGAASDAELRWLPRALLFAGGSWIFMWLSLVLPFRGGQHPFAVVVLDVALTPLAALVFIGVLGWIVILRRLVK